MLEVKDLRIHFRSAPEGHDAVKGISFSVGDGEIIGMVGESGSGKTVTAMAVSGLLPEGAAECSGSICLDGLDLLNCTPEELRQRQGTDLAVVFQEPMTSLDPVMKIGPQVEESLRIHTKKTAKERKEAALAAMAEAELPDPEVLYEKYPHELSGGMLQRVMIAAAIISRPRLLLADEPTTALDVTIQAQILQLLKKINREFGTSILFISHNLNVVRKLCSQIVVMNKGAIVERGSTDQIFYHPQEEYTRRLIAAIPTRTHRLY
ncbi:MAG: ABC transporter ATP-binding protein [Candidatus Onthomonas sp.]|nr:ABC transporter ATP-binding protein [Candidatus Onthomonas sp.]